MIENTGRRPGDVGRPYDFLSVRLLKGAAHCIFAAPSTYGGLKMRRTLTALLLAMTASCQEASKMTAPALSAPESPARVIEYQSYICEGPNPNNGGFAFMCRDRYQNDIAYLLTPNMSNFCKDNTEMCEFHMGGDPTTFANPIYPYPTESGDDADSTDTETTKPNCAAPATMNQYAWCSGTVPVTFRYTRIAAAVTAMRALGGICATLANTISTVMSRGDLHVFTLSDIYSFSATAPPNGGATGPKSWMAIATYWTDVAIDPEHAPDEEQPRDLQSVLAHEADHLLNYPHIDGLEHNTTHSQACGGMQ